MKFLSQAALCLLFSAALFAQTGPFSLGQITAPPANHINGETPTIIPFKDGHLITSRIGNQRVYLYYFDGTDNTEVSIPDVADFGDLGPVTGGRIVYTRDRISNAYQLQFLSATDFSLQPLNDQQYLLPPTALVFPDYLLVSVSPQSETMRVLRISADPDATEVLLTETSVSQLINARKFGDFALYATGNGLFFTDGTTANTFQLTAQRRVSPFEVYAFNENYYFTDGDRLFVFDGTAASLRQVSGWNDADGERPDEFGTMTVTDEGILFVGRTPRYGRELYLTDGVSGAQLVRDFAPGAASGIFRASDWNFYAGNSAGIIPLIVKNPDEEAYHIWQTDGTVTGTFRLDSIPFAPRSAQITPLLHTADGDSFVDVLVRSETGGLLTWTYGVRTTASELRYQLLDAPDSSSRLPFSFFVAGDWVLYYSTNAVGDFVTAARFRLDSLVLELPAAPYYPSFGPTSVVQEDQVFFNISMTGSGREPGSYTLGGDEFILLGDFVPGPPGSAPYFFGGEEGVYFLANTEASGYGIYRTDGTAEGTSYVTDLHDRTIPAVLERIVPATDEILVQVDDAWSRTSGVTDSLLPFFGEQTSPVDARVGEYEAFTFLNAQGFEIDYVFVTANDRVAASSFYPEFTAFSTPVSFGDEFAFFSAPDRNSTNVKLNFLNPITRALRQMNVANDGALPFEEFGKKLLSLGETLFYTTTDTNGEYILHRYTLAGGLQDLTSEGGFTPGCNGYRGLKNELGLLYSDSRVGDNGMLTLVFPSTTEAVPFRPNLLNNGERPLGAVNLPDGPVVLTSRRLSRAFSATDLREDGDRILHQDESTDASLGKLTYVSDTAIYFVKYFSTDRFELWKTNGSPEGTQLVRQLNGRLFDISSEPLAQIPGHLAFSVNSTNNGTAIILYDYVNDRLYEEDFGSRLTNSLSAPYGIRDRLYFLRTNGDGIRVLNYLTVEEIDGEAGFVYHDVNRNGLRDEDEDGVPDQPVRISSTDRSFLTFTNAAGEYTRFLQADTEFEISIEPQSCWEATTATIVNVTDTSATPNFGLALINNFADLTLSLTSAPVRCGFTVPFWLNVRNTGCQSLTNVEVHLNFDAEIQLDSIRFAPDETTDQSLSWTIPELPVGATWTNIIYLRMPNENRTGDVLPFLLRGAGIYEFDLLAEAELAYEPTLRCAIDPNDKLVSPTRTENNYTQIDETLTYTIRFQNTGNDTALNVRLEDQLDPQLDLKTFRPLAASHAYRVELADNGFLKVFFDDIFLPDSNANYQASNGFFTFTIDLLETALDQTVDNTAGIYFDFNAPVITNTVTNAIVEFLDEDEDDFFFWEDCDDGNPAINPAAFDTGGNGIDEDCDGNDWTTSVHDPLPGDLSLFPNPTNGLLQVRYSLPSDLLLEVFDGRGRRMQSEVFKSDVQLDISDLPLAIYQLKLTDRRSGQFTSRRIVRH